MARTKFTGDWSSGYSSPVRTDANSEASQPQQGPHWSGRPGDAQAMRTAGESQPSRPVQNPETADASPPNVPVLPRTSSLRSGPANKRVSSLNPISASNRVSSIPSKLPATPNSDMAASSPGLRAGVTMMTDPETSPCSRPACQICREAVFDLPPWVQMGAGTKAPIGIFPITICVLCRYKTSARKSGLAAALRTFNNFKKKANNHFELYNTSIDEDEFQTVVEYLTEYARAFKVYDLVSEDQTGALDESGVGDDDSGPITRRHSSRPAKRRYGGQTLDTPSGVAQHRAKFRVESGGAAASTRGPSALSATALDAIARRIENVSADGGEDVTLKEYIQAVIQGNASAYKLHLVATKHPQLQATHDKRDEEMNAKLDEIEALWKDATKHLNKKVLPGELPHFKMAYDAVVKDDQTAVFKNITPIKQLMEQLYAVAERGNSVNLEEDAADAAEE